MWKAILQVYFKNSFYESISWSLHVKLVISECHKTHWCIVNIGTGNDLVSSGNKPIPQAMLTQNLCHHITILGHKELIRIHWGIMGKIIYVQHVMHGWVMTSYTMVQNVINSSDARSLQCLLMPWLINSPGHQQARYWLYKISNMYGCSFVKLVFLCWTKSKIWYEMWMYL